MVVDCTEWIGKMDELDNHLIAALKRNGRASLSELASLLNVTRSTVRVRLDRLVQGGEIAGFTILTRSDVRPDAVRGLMMLEIAGRGAENIMKQLQRMSQVQAVHSTNGTWDLIAEIGTRYYYMHSILKFNRGVETKSRTGKANLARHIMLCKVLSN